MCKLKTPVSIVRALSLFFFLSFFSLLDFSHIKMIVRSVWIKTYCLICPVIPADRREVVGRARSFLDYFAFKSRNKYDLQAEDQFTNFWDWEKESTEVTITWGSGGF